MEINLEGQKVGVRINPGEEPQLAPGVRGILFNVEEGIYIPFIAADNPGNGDVARFLDALPTDMRVVFPTVISGKLAKMLEKRGFVLTQEMDETFGELVPIMERKPV